MKDEYDFSGATRGKFYRPSSRVRLPYHRASQSWFDDVAVTGRWWQPEFWREPDYLAASPWSQERLDTAFRVLMQLYPEDQAKAALSWVGVRDATERARRLRHPLWPLLACPMRPDLSALLRLGFDAVDADALHQPQLLRRLRTDASVDFKSARFELRCLAAFRNAGLDVSSEPLSDPGRSVDFRMELQSGRFIYMEAKYAEEGEWAKEEQTWFWRLSMPRAGHADISGPPISAHVRLTEKFQALQDTDEGRSFLRANIDEIALKLADTKLSLARSGGPFPASESVDGLIIVTVMGPPGDATSGNSTGVPTDSRHEVARVVGGAVVRSAMQIPPHASGVVLLDPGMHAPSHLFVSELRRWMRAEGAIYPNLAGVLVMVEALIEPEPNMIGRIEQFVPIWRDETPSWIVDGPWDALSDALAARDREALAHRAKISGDGENDDILRSAVG